MQARSVASVESATRTLEGDGFPVRRSLSNHENDDPFLLLDEIGPVDWRPGEAVGTPAQPRRGFAALTYLVAGALDYRDSLGHVARLAPGGAHWVCAGDGMVCDERPTADLRERGGIVHGFSLWVNVPRRAKTAAPAYAALAADDIAVIATAAGTVRVLGGRFRDASVPTPSCAPMLALHVTVRAGATLEVPVDRGERAAAYVFRGAVRTGGETVERGQLARYADDGSALALRAAGRGEAQVLVVAGRPIAEPVARYGPFVMTTHEEIVEAFADYRAGRLVSLVSG